MLSYLLLKNSCVIKRVSLCDSGSCPNLIMSRNELAIPRSNPVNLTPQLLPRVHRPLCVSVSSDSSGRFKALETPEWKNNLKAQVCATALKPTGHFDLDLFSSKHHYRSSLPHKHFLFVNKNTWLCHIISHRSPTFFKAQISGRAYMRSSVPQIVFAILNFFIAS